MIKKFIGSQLRRNMVSGTASMFVSFILMLVSYRIYLEYLGYEAYGVWLILATVLTFLEMGGNLGIEPAVTKLVAEEYGRQNLRGIQSYIVMALIAMLTTGTMGLFILIMFNQQIIALFNLEGGNALIASRFLPYMGLLCIYIFSIQALTGALSGLGRMDLTNYVRLAGRVFLLCVSVLLLWFGAGIESLLVGNIVSYFVIHVASIILIRRILPVRLFSPDNLDWGRLVRLLRFGLGIVGGSVANMLISPFNKLILSNYVGVESIPVYDIAYRGSMQARGLADVSLQALMPEVSRIGADAGTGGKQRIAAIYRRAVKLVVFGGVPLFILGIATVRFTPILKLWLGDKFVAELPGAVNIMLFGALLGLLGVPAYYILIGLGRVRDTVISHIIQSTLNVALVTAFLIVFSTVTVAKVTWMTSAAMGFSTIYLIWRSWRTVHSAA